MKKIDFNVRAFISSILVILVLMIISYVLTIVLPSGEYTRIINEAGNEVIDTSIPFVYVEGGLSFEKFLLSPFLVLGMSGGATIIAIVIFLFVIGGIFKCLEESGIMKYFLNRISNKYSNSKYKLLYLISLVFMLMGSFMGSFEEIIPLVPIMCSICIILGFDSLVGISISVLAGACGFACGITNPFTIGIANSIAGLPMFYGIGYRLIVFVIVYVLLILYIRNYASNHENKSIEVINFNKDLTLDKATNVFIGIMVLAVLCVVCSCFIKALQDYTMIIVALMFLIAGIVSCVVIKMPFKEFVKYFFNGLLGIAPAALMVLMASSIKYILIEGKTLDTILHFLISSLDGLPTWVIVLLIYVVFLVMEIFIASGSAKAFLLMPLILPIAQVFNIPIQVVVLCFAFGDGFSNVLYPTNPGLLVSLSLADVSYTNWLKYAYKFFISLFVVTCLLLMCFLYIF